MKNKGITLILLVIIIILLIILAGIGINLVMEGNGIFNTTKYAKQLYENAEEEEKEKLNEIYSQLLIASDGTINNISVESLKTLIENEVKEQLKKTSTSSTPTGAILAQMSKEAPEGYLICDGKQYNIEDYPQLSNYIKEQFGSYNYWGGNGTTTFCVPNLQGEFLRGYSTSANESVTKGVTTTYIGKHQEGTLNPYLISSNAGTAFYTAYVSSSVKMKRSNEDLDLTISGSYTQQGINTNKTSTTGKITTQYLARPTNTAVLYCIKY